ncbi:hypothetical protein WUBG_06118 [Wuchereria bancrofti]|uniref:Uncharacterized protein n=1 Tax=Wuchereria bancrofti TaxID=6293 RepID=J9F6G6_WUCBA|nr:hypothetical protein WUBG_06118 [Wuchereria bancrofti]
MITFFTFLSLLISVTQSGPLENTRLISSDPNNKIRFKRQFGRCGQYCCCTTFCCCVQRFSPPPATLPPTTTHLTIPPVCCQISQHICCRPEPPVIQPPPVCCMQTGQVLVPQQEMPTPLPAPLPAIGQCNCHRTYSHLHKLAGQNVATVVRALVMDAKGTLCFSSDTNWMSRSK